MVGFGANPKNKSHPAQRSGWLLPDITSNKSSVGLDDSDFLKIKSFDIEIS